MNIRADTIFRDYQPSSAQRSDRSAGDRARHRKLVKESIKQNLPDIISEESIIGKSGDKIIKIPIKGLKEYRFVYGDNEKGAAQGDGNSQPGQVVGKKGQQPGQGKDKAGDKPGEDIYETEVTLDEITQLLFEELQLPNLKKTSIKEIIEKSKQKKDGYRRVGIEVRLDRFKTARERVKRKKAMERHSDPMEECPACDGLGCSEVEYDSEAGAAPECSNCNGLGKVERRVRFNQRDLRYRHMDTDPKPQSNAAIIFIMDTSGSMDTAKKFLARSFFYLLYLFIRAKYERSELVFISHHTEAQEVNEDDFFHKGESGGTFLSSGLNKAIEIINARYNPAVWNNYVMHLTDGDNFDTDNKASIKAMNKLCELCSLVGYGEIKPDGSSFYESSMTKLYKEGIKAPNYKFVKITSKGEIWEKLKEFLSIDKEV